MGQKANPNSVRLVINKDWKSKWFSQKYYTAYFLEDSKIIKLLEKKLGKNAGIALITIARDPQRITVSLHTSKPGIIIGRSGQGVIDLTKFVEAELLKIRNEFTYAVKRYFPTGNDKKNQINKIKIDIIEVREPELNAELIAQNIALQLEKRVAYRKAIKQAMTKVMQKKAKGIKVMVAGRLGGVEIARREQFKEGSIPLGTFREKVEYAQEDALTVYGIVGVKVWILK